MMAEVVRPDDATTARVILGQATADEVRRVAAWRAASPEDYDRFMRLWSELEPGSQPEFDARGGWNDLANRLQFGSAPKHRRWVLAVACLAAAVVAAFWIVAPFDQAASWVVVDSLEGELVRLRDGSTVKLEAGSRLEYRQDMNGDSRDVRLLGRAVFDVAHGPRPFVVHTEELAVEVLGTRFDVWSRAGRSEVLLARGRLRVTDASGQRRDLMPGQWVAATQSGFLGDVGQRGSDRLGWDTDGLDFDRQPLRRVVRELEAQYGKSIAIAPGVNADVSLTGRFPRGDLAGILDELCLTLDLKVRSRGDGFEISAKDKSAI